MRPDQVRYFVIATLGLNITQVFHSNKPDSPNSAVTVYAENENINVHTMVTIAPFQAIIRKARNVATSIGEAQARVLLDRVRSLHNRISFDGCFLTATMSGITNPVSFDPDDGSGSSTASTFTANDYILIGSEILKVTTIVSDTVTASRAQLGTTIAAHANNDEAKNITQNPIPGELCDSAVATQGVMDMGLDDKQRREWVVNWRVILKS